MAPNETPTPVYDRRASLTRHETKTMDYFLQANHLDPDTAALLQRYDADGSGAFSKDEVVAIILDLREQAAANERLKFNNVMWKRAVKISIVFLVLLLLGMFGLSYAVAAMTAKTKVEGETLMRARDSSNVIVSTDDRADLHILTMNTDTGSYCTTLDEVLMITDEISTGRRVLVELDDEDGSFQSMDTLLASGATIEDDTFCFTRPSDGSQFCFTPNPACGEDNGRKLSDEKREELLAHHRRLGRRLPPGGYQGGDSTADEEDEA